MRLGVLLDRFDPRGGGAEAHTDALVRRALETGDEVVAASLDGSAPDGAGVVRVEVPARRPARDRAFASQGVRQLRDAGCDVVLGFRHCPGVDVYLPHGGLVRDSARAQERARGGAGFFRRLSQVLSGKLAFFLEAEERLLRPEEGPVVVCVSRGLAERMRRAFPACADRLVVVPNGVDVEHFDPAGWQDEGRALRDRLGIGEAARVGLLLAHRPGLKGASTAIEALALDREEERDVPLHLVVAGGTLTRALKRRVVRRGLVGTVHEVGHFEDPRPLYAAADVLVHPTWHDPCSLACLEAMAMEVPVITTPENGVHELMGTRGGIVLEEPGNPEALAVALGVLADPDLSRATGEDARGVAAKNPRIPRLDAVLDVCRRTLGPCRPPASSSY